MHANDDPPPLRGRRERLIQAFWFEALGVVLVSPVFALASGSSPRESVATMAALSVAVSCWSAAYNTAFDRLECRWSGRVASARPPSLRMVHALGLEGTAVVLTWPLIVALTPLGWLAALRADLGLTIGYVAYGYAFHLGFDRLRPVPRASST